jgi:hypothetical protein
MGFFNLEVINPTKGVEIKVGESAKGGHLAKTSTYTLTSLKWGRVTCFFRWTFKCGGSPSWGPSSDHHGVALAVTWVMNLSVRLGLACSLTNSRTT